MQAERTLPTNIDAERFVLGSILLDDSLHAQVASALPVEAFSLDKHRRIYSRMAPIAARGERIDRITLANELMKHNELVAVDGLSYLVSLDDGLPQVPNVDSYVRILQEKATLRSIIFAADHLAGMAAQSSADPSALLRRASEQFLSLVGTQQPDELQTPYEVIEEEIARNGLDAFFAGGSRGIQTPVAWLNDITQGLHDGDLILLGARPSIGKTALMMQMAHTAALGGYGCIVFSLEMGKYPLSLRIACSASNVDSQAHRSGLLDANEQHRLREAIGELKDLPLWIDKSSRTVEAMHAKVRRARASRGVSAVFVDYIQLMGTDDRTEGNQNAKVSAISRGLKLMAEEFEIPVVALSQLSRPPKGSNPEPDLSDLRDSGSLEQDADVVLMLHSVDGKLGTGPRRLLLRKQRNGPVGFTDLAFVGKYQRFEELAKEVSDGEY